jgi:hypothetical protein
MREYYVMTVKQSTGADKYLVICEVRNMGLVIYDKWDTLKGALNAAEILNRGD